LNPLSSNFFRDSFIEILTGWLLDNRVPILMEAEKTLQERPCSFQFAPGEHFFASQ
jgi:hypothetical protein